MQFFLFIKVQDINERRLKKKKRKLLAFFRMDDVDQIDKIITGPFISLLLIGQYV